MMYSFDSNGWLADGEILGRCITLEPPAHGNKVIGQPYPNFNGVNWVLVPYHLTPAAPVAAQAWLPFEFYRRLLPQERIAIRALAKTDPVADDFMRSLDNAIASGTLIHADDPDVVAGFGYLQVYPIGSPCLTPARAAAILT